MSSIIAFGLVLFMPSQEPIIPKSQIERWERNHLQRIAENRQALINELKELKFDEEQKLPPILSRTSKQRAVVETKLAALKNAEEDLRVLIEAEMDTKNSYERDRSNLERTLRQ